MNRAITTVGMMIVWGTCQFVSAAITGQYLFEEGSGATALNTAANPLGDARNGSLVHVEIVDSDPVDVVGGPTYVSGLYKGSNYALLFNSAQRDRVVLPQSTNFITNAPGASLLAWVRIDEGHAYFDPEITPNPATAGIFATIAQVNNGTTVDPTGVGARAALTVSTHQGFRAVGSRANEGRSAAESAFCQPNFEICATVGKTYFVAGVFDYVNRRIDIYLDGQPLPPESGFGSNINPNWSSGNSDNTANLFASIGGPPVATGLFRDTWHGAIDGVRIYDEALSAQQILDIYNAEVLVAVQGDYNGNGVVDAADYVLWRAGDLSADGTGPSGVPDGIVDGLDYDFWKARFGNTTNPGSRAIAEAAVPEPASWTILFVSVALAVFRRTCRRSS